MRLPDGEIVPDLKQNLPGRGVWVTATKDHVTRAVSRSSFGRGLKQKVSVRDDLADFTDGLLAQAATNALGFARKAGECVNGAAQVESLLFGGKVMAVLHASDAAPDGIRKLTGAMKAAGERVKAYRPFNSQEMSLALGTTNVIHAALTHGGAAKNCLRRIKALERYRNGT